MLLPLALLSAPRPCAVLRCRRGAGRGRRRDRLAAAGLVASGPGSARWSCRWRWSRRRWSALLLLSIIGLSAGRMARCSAAAPDAAPAGWRARVGHAAAAALGGLLMRSWQAARRATRGRARAATVPARAPSGPRQPRSPLGRDPAAAAARAADDPSRCRPGRAAAGRARWTRRRKPRRARRRPAGAAGDAAGEAGRPGAAAPTRRRGRRRSRCDAGAGLPPLGSADERAGRHAPRRSTRRRWPRTPACSKPCSRITACAARSCRCGRARS